MTQPPDPTRDARACGARYPCIDCGSDASTVTVADADIDARPDAHAVAGPNHGTDRRAISDADLDHPAAAHDFAAAATDGLADAASPMNRGD